MKEKAQLSVLPFRVVIDDYLVGDLWLAYSRGERTYRGRALADGLELGDRLQYRILSLEKADGGYLGRAEINDYLREQELEIYCSDDIIDGMLDYASDFYEIEMRQGTKYASLVTGAEFAFALDGDNHVELLDITLREQMPVIC